MKDTMREREHYIAIRTDEIQKHSATISNACKDAKCVSLSQCGWWEGKMVSHSGEQIGSFPRKLNIHLAYHSGLSIALSSEE